VQAAVVLRKIARAATRSAVHRLPPANHFHARANSVAIALCAHELYSIQWPVPVETLCSSFALGAEIHHVGVDLAVVLVVGKAGAARHGALAQHRAGFARDVLETAVAEPAKQRVLLRMK
jgi:hypothetical protein